MFYIKKPRIIPFTEKTLAEKLTGTFDLKQEPTKKQTKRFYWTLLMCFVLLFCNWFCVEAHAPEVEMGNGAGNEWTCSNCGQSNYCWQMSCSNCGNSQ